MWFCLPLHSLINVTITAKKEAYSFYWNFHISTWHLLCLIMCNYMYNNVFISLIFRCGNFVHLITMLLGFTLFLLTLHSKNLKKPYQSFQVKSYIYGTEEMAKLFENSDCFWRGRLIESQYWNHGSRPSMTPVLGFPSPLLSSAIIRW